MTKTVSVKFVVTKDSVRTLASELSQIFLIMKMILTITHMVYRFVYRYGIIFHDINFWKIIKNLLES